ncbi:hypothetical protein RJ641_031167 [Dillenia turbinata]|uniref:Uncharacterized protein n=1 Tax=Dillenia turbinata TaxID=194707 RepID=A0AAN8VPK1_9MAGN
MEQVVLLDEGAMGAEADSLNSSVLLEARAMSQDERGTDAALKVSLHEAERIMSSQNKVFEGPDK